MRILLLMAVSPAVHADDLFSRAEKENRAFWRQGEKALWTAVPSTPPARIDVFLSDDDELDDEFDYEGDLDELVTLFEADYRGQPCLGLRQEVSLPNGHRTLSPESDCWKTERSPLFRPAPRKANGSARSVPSCSLPCPARSRCRSNDAAACRYSNASVRHCSCSL